MRDALVDFDASMALSAGEITEDALGVVTFG